MPNDQTASNIPIDDPVYQTPVYPWPSDCGCSPHCSRCKDGDGWFHDADGARKCRECFKRSCKVCHVAMSQHGCCTGPCE